ncbi:hypothetical protein B0H17DRAFT_1280350, partial [Mycena rosella]
MEGAIPLLFVHGRTCFRPAGKITPLLTEVHPDHPTFHIDDRRAEPARLRVLRSAAKKGFRLAQYAEVSTRDRALGYSEYAPPPSPRPSRACRLTSLAHGRPLTQLQPPAHPLCTRHDPPTSVDVGGDESRAAALVGGAAHGARLPPRIVNQTADARIRARRLACGVFAWIYEKLVAWTDEYPWVDDEVLTWMSIYWFLRAGPAASLRIYCDVEQEDRLLPPLGGPHPTIPLGYSVFLNCSWARRTGNVVFEAEHEVGGHFAAHEVPAFLVGNLRKMFGRGGPAYGVVSGWSGY